MVSLIKAEGFKGLTFEQPLEKRTLFVGPNGAGKSSRTQALVLALLGYIPGSGKKNAEILENFGAGKRLVVGVEIGKDLFERGFVISGDVVNQAFKVNGKKASKDIFTNFLTRASAPIAFDIPAFMNLSDQKKIDTIFDLYPPATDIRKLIVDIEKAKDRINILERKKKTAEEGAARLATSRAMMQLPVGSLAELQEKERTLSGQLSRAREQIGELRIEEAREQERKKQQPPGAQPATAPVETQPGQKSETKPVPRETIEPKPETERPKAETKEVKSETAVIHTPVGDTLSPAGFEKSAAASGLPADSILNHAREEISAALSKEIPAAVQAPFVGVDLSKGKDETAFLGESFFASAVESIQAILDALNKAGCSACAARLVAIRELNKYRRVAA